MSGALSRYADDPNDAGTIHRGNAKRGTCYRCPVDCDILAMAAVGFGVILWVCPLAKRRATDAALVEILIRAAFSEATCIIIRVVDLYG